MIKNYLKTALRNINRYKGFSGINIVSLSIALTGCLIIGLFVWDELQYDKFIKGGENIYRFYTKRTDNTGVTSTASVPPMFATYVQQQYPEVENTNRIIMLNSKMLVENGDVKTYEEKWIATEPSFFNFFPLKFLKGEPNTSLSDPNSIVITEDFAKTFFGSQDPIGKVIKINKSDVVVKGVLANLPPHFHLDFKFIMPLSALGLPKERMQNWQWQQFFTYIKVKPGTNIQQLQNKFQLAVKKEADPKNKERGFTFSPYLQALKDIHLTSSDFIYDNAKRGNADYVKALTIIAIFVLIIAIFNFINLATARSFRRAKEIGVRKVIGADRRQLVLQFTSESVLLAMASIIISVIAALLILPSLNRFTEKNISFPFFSNPLLALSILLAGIVIGILAGIYPALFMSGFQPIKVLKGLKPGAGNTGFSSSLRKGLVIVQFALSALLIVCTTIVYRQITFLHNKDLGFNKDQVIYFDVRGDVEKHPETFKQEILRTPGVVSATAGYGLPGDVLAGDEIIVPGKEGDKTQSVNLFIVDHDYIKTMGLQLVKGRDFSRNFATDTSEAFIINETAVRELGFKTPQNAVGQPLAWNKWEKDSLNPVKKGKIIGVVKDFHYKSLHEKVSAAVLQIYSPVIAKMAVKVKAADLPKTIAFIKSAWNKFSPDYPLDYKFLDENFAIMYKAEDKLSSLLWIFTVMAIFVGCMGLFGLAAFSAEQRTKEIGIRKVLGASVMNIVTMLSKNFLKPVFIASVIAFPVAWWAMNKWLEDFPYRVNISWWIFAVAGIAALLIALITVSFQAIKAALSNPVKNLRAE
ncbi:MAG: FtsX-like permease family protein [Chitinophagaceae bacterium]|nr:FtsX-like permease family protein [Chitinophagaceae bacterium]